MTAARLLVFLVSLSAPLAAEAQSAIGIPRVGLLRPGAPTDPADRSSVGAFLTGLQEADYAQGRNVHVESRYAHGDLGRPTAGGSGDRVTTLIPAPTYVLARAAWIPALV